jgi:uncharacterized protein (DUF4415 family)
MQVKSKSGRVFELPTPQEEAEIRKGIAADPDTCELTDEELAQLRPVGRPKAQETRERVTIRLSPEVTAFFRATGKGWQTRVDGVLKEYVESHR